MSIAEQLKELAYRRYALTQEIYAINSQMLIRYEQLFLAAAKGEVNLDEVCKYLNDRDERILRKSLPELSKTSSMAKTHTIPDPVQPEPPIQQVPENVVQEPLEINSEDIKPVNVVNPSENNATSSTSQSSNDDDDVDDKPSRPPITFPPQPLSFEDQVIDIKRSERYKRSVETNKKNLDDYKIRILNVTTDKREEYKKRNISVLSDKIKNMKQEPTSKDPGTYLSNQITLTFYENCLQALNDLSDT